MGAPAGEPDMKGQIERRWEALSELVAKTLNGLPQAARPYAPPQDPGWTYQMPAEPPTSPPSPAPPAFQTPAASAVPAASSADERRARLREQRAALKEALLAGRISEQMYRELREDIDAEYGDL
jgi:hypothetical protein